MANGILIIDKPAGWTSQDVAARLRRVFHERRIGHGGTLDPMATGVLPIFIGRATRAVEFFESAEKEYLAGLRLGLVTNTQDTTGETIMETAAVCSREDVAAVLPRFTGELQQLPPMYSAVKIGGKKLYELARQGKEVVREPRAIRVFSLEVLSDGTADNTLRVHCSKGTYVRTLCHDIGQALGCGACMSSLRRTRAGRFTLDNAISLQSVLDAKNPEALLLSVDTLFFELPALTLNQKAEQLCRNGAKIPLPHAGDGMVRVYGVSGEFLMVGSVENGVLTTIKSFFEVK